MIKVFRLPLRTAIATGLACAIALLAAGFALTGAFPLRLVVLVSVLTGAACYVTVRFLLRDKLKEIEKLLLAIEERAFDAVGNDDPEGTDELSELVRLARRSGKSVRKEMEEMKKMESYRRDFVGNVSHELKTPIFAIKGFSETLLGGAIDDLEVNRSFVRKILRNADRLHNLARDLAEISAMETGELKMERAPFSINRTVCEVLESLEPAASEKGIAVRAVVPESLPDALGDQERIRQVLTNLVDNALKYTNRGGNVEVVVRLVDPAEIKISVVDDGIGIAPEHLSRVTERFYRVDKSRSRSQGGTGLGLSIVKHILAVHGRRLQVNSSEGRGSTFGFSLDAVLRAIRDPDRHEVADTDKL